MFVDIVLDCLAQTVGQLLQMVDCAVLFLQRRGIFGIFKFKLLHTFACLEQFVLLLAQKRLVVLSCVLQTGELQMHLLHDRQIAVGLIEVVTAFVKFRLNGRTFGLGEAQLLLERLMLGSQTSELAV